jgi:hypothetical protein
LSASGLSSCVRDAKVLQEALQRHPRDLAAAATDYAAQRRAPQRTRIALASALYRAFSEQSPEMAALRGGLFRYWERTRTGRAVSMALLSTRELRMWVMAREYARAVAHGLIALPSLRRAARARGSFLATALALIRSILPHLRGALAGAVENVGWMRVRLKSRAAKPQLPQDARLADPEPNRAPLPRL